MTYRHLKVSRSGHLATITFDRPQSNNALNIELMNEIVKAVETFEEDDQTRVVIFTGNGEHFSAGVDLKDEKRVKQQTEDTLLLKYRHAKIGPRMIRAVYEMNQITIAAINGAAMGGGACIATACDFRIGADNCFAGYPEVNLAMNLSWVSLPLLVHLVGQARAKKMVILANRQDPQTLLNWGFLDEVVPADDLMRSAVKMAELYALQAPLAAQMVKRSINAISSALDQAIMHMDTDQFLFAVSGEDFYEAVGAYFEKRKPIFKGN